MAELQPDKGAVIRDANGDIIPDDAAPVKRDTYAEAQKMRGAAKVAKDEEAVLRDTETRPTKTTRIPVIGGIDNYEDARKFSERSGGMTSQELFDTELANAEGEKLVTALRSTMGGAGVGGVLKGVDFAKKGAQAFKLTSPSVPVSQMTTPELVKTALSKATEHVASKYLLGETATGATGELAKRAVSGAKSVAGASVPAAGTAVANAPAVARAETNSGPFSNMIDRLRASADANPRAALLLSKITEMQSNPPLLPESAPVQ